METWDAISARRDVREFADRGIPDADLDRVLEAGRIAPSSQNNQPWDFVVVTDRELLRELSGVWRGGGHIANAAAAWAMCPPPRHTVASSRSSSRSVTTTKSHGWLFCDEGAIRPASRMRSRSASGITRSANSRTFRRAVMASQVSIYSSSLITGLAGFMPRA